VKQRIFTETKPTPAPDITFNKPNSVAFEVIHLNHIDPFDLMSVLGNIIFINQFSRYTGGMNGNIGGGFGASGGSGNNSMGSFGGGGMGNGNGMGGGAMGGFGGGAFGGMNGGVGGFGGGRNF